VPSNIDLEKLYNTKAEKVAMFCKEKTTFKLSFIHPRDIYVKDTHAFL
jgi:hypothetical protein